VHSLAKKLLATIQNVGVMKPGDRIGVAVSGGADSVALLRLAIELKDELGVVLSVVHFNHRIRGAASDSDEAFVRELASRYDLEFHHSDDDVPSYAVAEHLSLEAAGRRLRYRFFESLLRRGVLDRIATAHTLDDQAETVLLRMLRGAGTRGLAGIFPMLTIEPDGSGDASGAIVRPLLHFRRPELEAYLTDISQTWRNDASNKDMKHARNRVRQKVLPVLESVFTPAVRERLGEVAEIARAEEEHWEKSIREILPSVQCDANVLIIHKLVVNDLAVRRRLVRAVAEHLGLNLEFSQVEDVLRLAESPARGEKQIMLGEEWCAVRSGDRLYFERRARTLGVSGYEYVLRVPGSVTVPELHSVFDARIIPRAAAGNRGDQMLSARVAAQLTIRNWRPGDRFFPAHTKSSKKLKEVLQERHIPQAERHSWPVIQSGDEIVWVRGFACPAHLLPKEDEEEVLVISEHPEKLD
jgi:tRNA(Ile)-lysidine synthase